MMNRWTLAAVLMVTSVLAGADTFAPSVAVSDRTLSKVAEARYSVLWKRITDVALYVDADKPKPADGDILNPDYAKYLTIEYGVSVSAERFEEMSRELIEENWPPGAVARQQAAIDRFCDWLQAVKEGDRYAVYWIPGKGLSLALNGEVQGTLADPEGAQIILSLWLGRAAVSKSQRDELLKSWFPQKS